MSSLAGSGKVGKWVVDIDHEDPAGHGFEWSVTIRHPRCYVQAGLPGVSALAAMNAHIRTGEPSAEFFRLGRDDEVEVLVGLAEAGLVWIMRRDRRPGSSGFPFLLECAVGAEETSDLVAAVEEALSEALSP